MIDEYPTQLRTHLRKLTDDFKEIWAREFESEIDHYKYRLERKGAFDIVYFIYSIPEIEQLESYNELKKLVETQIVERTYHLSSNTILDYLLLSVTNNELSYDNLFSEQGFEAAYQLLLEDTTYHVNVNHGVALVSGLEFRDQIVEISDNIRFRRVSRFEIDYEKKFERGFYIPDFAANPFDYHRVNSIYFLEVALDEPFILPDEQIKMMDELRENLERKSKLKLESFIPTDHLKGISTDIVDNLFHNFLSCFRLLWGYDVRIHWIFYRSERLLDTGKPTSSWKTGKVKSEFLADQSSGIQNNINLKDDEIVQLTEFWDVVQQFEEKLDQSTMKYFERSLVRFNRSFIEEDFEDAIIDLAICLEILTSGAKGMTSFLVAPFVAFANKIEKVEKEIADFDRIRNGIVHGSVSSVDKIDLNQWTLIGRKVASACLRNFVFYVTNLTDQEPPRGKRGIRDTLDACRVSIEKQSWLHKIIPAWSMIESTN